MELLYADDLVLMGETEELLMEKIQKLQKNIEKELNDDDRLMFNGTSTQKGQFMPIAGNAVHSKTIQLHKRENRLSSRRLICLLLH